METETPTALALDTDIGSDVDDLLALAVIFGSPELDLRAVTTVYGDTPLRARMVHRAHRVARRAVPPVAAGLSETRSGKLVWWAGHEGALMADLDSEAVDDTLNAVELLRGQQVVVAVGPLTNAAAAVEVPGALKHLVIMGGDFTQAPAEQTQAEQTQAEQTRPEHNIASDVAAAVVVFQSGVSATVVGLDQTTRVGIGADDIAEMGRWGPLGELLAAEIRQFQTFSGQPKNTPHDPIAVLMLVRPDLFTFARGRISVSADGVTTFSAEEDGPHRIVTDLDVEAVTGEILRRIHRASNAKSRGSAR